MAVDRLCRLGSDSDRLRRLDALFAEKVLGLEVEWLACPPHGDHYFDEGPVYSSEPMPRYTRSLDAAWEGVEKCGFGMLSHTDNPGILAKGKYVARVSTASVNHPPGKSFSNGEGRADHPAEAIVLACLKAVGVAEDELA